MGRGCASCKYYHEDKLTYSPESPLEKEEIAEFVDEIRQYQGWLESMQGKTVEFSGEIDVIAPHLEMKRDEQSDHVSMNGFYLAFERGHIGQDLFDDRLYMKIFGNLLERFNFAPGDHLECRAVFTETRGRIILQKPSRIEHTQNGGKRHVNVSRALVGRATGKIISGPADLCKNCPYVSLIDVEDIRRQKPVYYRRYYCLRGLIDPETCPVRLTEILEQSDAARQAGPAILTSPRLRALLIINKNKKRRVIARRPFGRRSNLMSFQKARFFAMRSPRSSKWTRSR